MKHTIEIHETAKRIPTKKDIDDLLIVAYSRRTKKYCMQFASIVTCSTPEEYPLWFSLYGLPRPKPVVRKRQTKRH